MRISFVVFVLHSALFAQTPLVIEGVTDSLTGETRLAPGSRALVRLTQNVSSESVTVQVGAKQAAILAVLERGVHILIPLELLDGTTMLTVTSRGTKTAPFALTLVSHAPVLASASIWPGTYCPVRAPWGTSLVAYGLGATVPVVPAGAEAPAAPLASTTLKPVLKVDGREAEVLSSALVPDRTNDGSYRIIFRVPPNTPEGSHPVVLSIAGEVSNTEMLEVRGIILKSAFTGVKGSAAAEAIMSAYACAAPLATGEVTGDLRNPPAALGGTIVRVLDSVGVERSAPVLYASPDQVNLIIPAGTAVGAATITVISGDMEVSRTAVQVQPVAPELMYVGSYPVGVLMRVRDGVQSFEPLVRTVKGATEVVPIHFGPSTEELFLLLFGTGLRGRSSLAAVKASIDGADAPVEYAGPQGDFAGLDQVNIRLPRALSGRAGKVVDFWLAVDGRLANADGDSLYLAIE